MNLGKIIKGWRESENLGIREAAKKVGVSAPTLSRIENGKPVDGQTLVNYLWLPETSRFLGNCTMRNLIMTDIASTCSSLSSCGRGSKLVCFHVTVNL